VTGASESMDTLHFELTENTVTNMKGIISIYQITKEKTRKDLWRQRGRKAEIRFVKQAGVSFIPKSCS
jgi:hypothetical protein